MSKLIKQINYAKIERDVSAIITRDSEGLKAAYRRQVLTTNWEVGRYLKNALPLEHAPSTGNARIIAMLSQKFKRPDSYFYGLIKFAREYPELPEEGPLSWSHYEAILRIDDPIARRKYLKMAVRRKISGKLLYAAIVNDKAQKATQRKRLKTGAPDAVIPLIRGRLYHYKVAAPKDAQSNVGIITLDAGFHVFRDIPLSKKSKVHVGHMVRTVQSIKSDDLFSARISPDKNGRLYTYVATVKRVVDGDTLVAMIDLGLKTKTIQRLRLRGIDTPELTTKRGKYVKDYVKRLLDKQKFIIVKTYKDDKWGRMLADIFYKTNEPDPVVVAENGIFLNQQLLDENLAQRWV